MFWASISCNHCIRLYAVLISSCFMFKMLYTHAGVPDGESEEVIDGVILHNDPNGIQASWGAVDPESGVRTYMVAVGTQPG